MGNLSSLPSKSNDDWIVITIPKSCKLQLCGKFELPSTENIDDERLVQDVYQRKGFVPRHQVEAKFEVFNEKIGKGRTRLMQFMWLSILIAVIVPQLSRVLILKDTEWYVTAAIVPILTYVPMQISIFLLLRHYCNEKNRVKEIFQDWQPLYFEEIDWVVGNKHSPPRLGFKISKAKQREIDREV